jgi:hypothetical protein
MRRVSAAQLRQMFNDDRLYERVQSGELQERVLKERHPSLRRAGEPWCTRSQIVGYYDAQLRKVALVHQYMRPDGRLGASGRPDPKRIFKDGELYALTGTN